MLILFIRTLIIYIVVVASLRFMGKRQLGQLQPSEMVIAMMISEVATIPMEYVGTPLVYLSVPFHLQESSQSSQERWTCQDRYIPHFH